MTWHNMFNSNSKIFRYFLICFIIGVTIASYFSLNYFWFYLLVLVSIIAMITFWPNKLWRWLFLGGLIIALGIFRYQLSLPKTDPTKIWFYNNSRLTFEGLVINEPDSRINQTKLTVGANQATVNGQQLSADGKVLVSVSLYPQYQYGDLLSINCKLQKPEPINGFAYDRYLAKEGIYSLCYYPKIKLLSQNQGDWLLSKIFVFKNKLIDLANLNLPEPQASLFNGINLGVRGSIPDDLFENFNIAGVTHLIAISGMNITIIAAILLQAALACYLSRKQAFWLISLILIVYIIIIGFPASAVRAAIMGWLILLAQRVGRLNRATNAILLSASVMILINPKVLRDDIGFQLSFAAIFGIIYFLPLMEKWFKKIPETLALRESISMTLASQLSTLPLVVFYFGRVSLIGLLVNLLVVPVLSYLMIISFIALILSWLMPIFSQYFFWPAWFLLTYLIKVVDFFSQLPYAALNL